MKNKITRLFLISIFSLAYIFTTHILGQVGIGTATPDASSALEINSTTKGLLPPRMTFENRNDILTPATGLMIWCTNCSVYGQLQIYNGYKWTNILGGLPAAIPVVGDIDGGGVVAYILQPGDPGYVAGQLHGLIAATSDQSNSASWGCFATDIPGADGLNLGTGNQNTIDIVNGCSTTGIAAKICYDLTLNGYSDWHLPSKDELNKLFINKVAIGGFTNNFYWCSSEANSQYVWGQLFSSGSQGLDSKTITYYVRAVRTF